MDYNLRIGENNLKGDWKDGEILQHTDLNEREVLIKAAINANYEDIQKILDGTYVVGSASGIAGATLSKYEDEPLASSDEKIPSSLQVKAYVDSAKQEAVDAIPDNVSAFTNDAGYTTNQGTITSVKMNGSTIATSGEANLGTVITEHQDISGKQDLLVSGTNIKTVNGQSILGNGNLVIEGTSPDYVDLTNKPSINSVELNGNKSLSDLGIQPAGNYLTSETDPVFSASASAGITSSDITNWDAKQNTIQYSTMPTASASTVGKIVQYTGTTDSTYTNGYFYIGVTDGDDPATYSWENLNVQDQGGEEIPFLIITYSNRADSDVISKLNEIFTAYKSGKPYLLYFYDYVSESSRNSKYLIPLNFIYLAGYSRYYLTGSISEVHQTMQESGGVFYPIYYISLILNVSNNIIQSISNITLEHVKMPHVNGGKILMPNNTYVYTPTGDYNPATKKYVDDQVGAINTVLATLTTPTSNGGN